MKKIFVISIHSIIDVITNSSTELFIIDESKTLDMIKEVISNLITAQNINSEKYDLQSIYSCLRYEEDIESYLKDVYKDWFPGETVTTNIKSGYLLIIDDSMIPYWAEDAIIEILNAEQMHLG
jgi:hypothetical protein